MSYVSVDMEIHIERIMDAMTDFDKEELAKELDLESIRSSVKYELNSRAVVGVLKSKKINLKELYDYLGYYYKNSEVINEA